MNITENVVLASVMMDGAVVCQINSDATSNVAHPAASALKESASSAQKVPEYVTITAAHLTAFAQNLVVGVSDVAHLMSSVVVINAARLAPSALALAAVRITHAQVAVLPINTVPRSDADQITMDHVQVVVRLVNTVLHLDASPIIQGHAQVVVRPVNTVLHSDVSQIIPAQVAARLVNIAPRSDASKPGRNKLAHTGQASDMRRTLVGALCLVR